MTDISELSDMDFRNLIVSSQQDEFI